MIVTPTLTTDGSGNATINQSYTLSVPVGSLVTAIASDANNNSFEFSACKIVEAATTAVQSNSNKNVLINPTLTNNMVYVIADRDFSYEVYDLQGRRVRQGLMKGQQTGIDLSDLNNGVYLLKVQGDNWLSEKKIMKH